MDGPNAPQCAIEIPEGSRQSDNTTIAQDSNLSVLTMRLDNVTDWMSAIPYILGTSTVLQNGPGAYKLSRTVPARHPYYPWMRATRILNHQGRGGAGYNTQRGRFYAGTWKKYYLTVQFEQPQYPMLSDDLGLPEYARWCIRIFKPNLETLARKGGAGGGVGWSWAQVPGRANTPTPLQYSGDVYLRQPKGILEIKWFDVPESWTHLGNQTNNVFGGLIPTNISRAVGTLNSRAFPQSPVPVDQNRLTGAVQFAPGTLLFLEPECKERTRLDPYMFTTQRLLLGNPATTWPSFNDVTFFPRSFDWTFRWLYFDPPYDVSNALQVSPQWDPTQTVNVRGHNLLALVTPNGISGLSWYPATNNLNASIQGNQLQGINGSVSGGDVFLLYPYFNHELIFSYARSLSASTGGLWPLDGTYTT